VLPVLPLPEPDGLPTGVDGVDGVDGGAPPPRP
jgi:hypothetical protein